MLKILIADDEKNICNLITNLLDWEGLNLVCAGIACNGQQAFDIARKERPDIIITDIRMPVISGMELIPLVRQELPDIKIIIISGYYLFDYAHRAIKYGVSDFLTKPINAEELQRVLYRVCREIHESRQNSQAAEELQRLTSQVANLSVHMRSRFVLNLFLGGEALPKSLTAINEEYFFSFRDQCFMGVFLHLDIRNTEDAYYKAVISQMACILRDNMAPWCADMEAAEQNENVVVLLNFAADDLDRICEKLQACFLLLQESIEFYPFYAVTLGVGSPVAFGQLAATAQESLLCVKARVVLGKNRVIAAGQLPKEDHTAPGGAQPVWQKLEQQADLRSRGGVLGQMEQLFAVHRAWVTGHPGHAQNLYQDILQRVMGTLAVAGLGSEKTDADRALARCSSLEELEEACRQLVGAVFDEYENEMKSSDTKTIQTAKNYIKERYDKKLDLEDVASQVYLSPAYFGILFKKETGETFTDYLANVRMEHAKELLAQLDLSISEIAGQVGYKDVRYFNKLFKRNVGVTASEYRKIQHNKSRPG